MHRVLRFTALLLLALWLPATMHCGFEAMLNAPTDQCCHGDDGNADAPADLCAIEDGNFRATHPENLILAPLLISSWWGSAVVRRPPVDAPAPRADASRPLDWVRTWQFVARAALPANAPSFVS